MAGRGGNRKRCSSSSDELVNYQTHSSEGFFPFPDKSFGTITKSSRPEFVGMRLTPTPIQIKWLEDEDEDEDEDIVQVIFSDGNESEAGYGTLIACPNEESAKEIFNVQLHYRRLNMHIITPCRYASLYYPKKKTETAFLFYPTRLVSLQSFLKNNHGNESIYSRLCREILISMRYLYDEEGRFHGNLFNGICVDERGKVKLWRIAGGACNSSNTDFVDLCKILELMNATDKNSHLWSFYEFVRLRSLTFDIESIIWVFNHPILWDYQKYHRFFVNLYYCSKYGLDNNRHFIDEFEKKNLCRFVEEAGKNDTFLEILELEDAKKRVSVYLYKVMTEYSSHVLPEDMLFLKDIINLILKYHPLVTEDLYECCFAAFSQDFSCCLCPNAKVFLSEPIGV